MNICAMIYVYIGIYIYIYIKNPREISMYITSFPKPHRPIGLFHGLLKGRSWNGKVLRDE